jgi:hypothetical protein
MVVNISPGDSTEGKYGIYRRHTRSNPDPEKVPVYSDPENM